MIIACNENRVWYNPICSKWENGNKSKLIICILIPRDDNALTLSFWHHFCWMSHQPVFRSLGINLKSKDTKQITFKYVLLKYIISPLWAITAINTYHNFYMKTCSNLLLFQEDYIFPFLTNHPHNGCHFFYRPISSNLLCN